MITLNRSAIRLLVVCLLAVCISCPALGDVQSIGAAKLLPDGREVSLHSKIVTYCASDYFYIQETDQSSGIRVVKSSHGLQPGMLAEVTGTTDTDDNKERFIVCGSPTGSGNGTAVPITMSNAAIGGSDWCYDPETGAGQAGIPSAHGLNNIGLLISTHGGVTYADPGGAFIYIDDGSGARDGNNLGAQGAEAPGVKVVLPAGIDVPKLMEFVAVAGVSSTAGIAGQTVRLVLARSTKDLARYAIQVEMVSVPAGEFLMGNSGVGADLSDGYERESPQHSVSVAAFSISKYEVTRGLYKRFMLSGGYSDSRYWSAEGWAWRVAHNRTTPDLWDAVQTWGVPFGPFTQTDDHPVVGVTYYEAEAFCRWADGRLPTEAEWEKAARWDGHPRVYPWGDTLNDEASNNWYDLTVAGFQTAPVGRYQLGASPCGCMDMAGNVWEWTQDWYRSYPGSTSPFDKTGVERVLRGGSWYGVYGLRSASRKSAECTWSGNDAGFRLVRSY
jgi:formylglycine-generating enzyme required for sulfatase activity